MKKLYKFIGIFCVLVLCASCAINLEFGKRDSDNKEAAEEKEQTAKCPESGDTATCTKATADKTCPKGKDPATCPKAKDSSKCPLTGEEKCCKRKDAPKKCPKRSGCMDPEKINPYCPNAGAFLDKNIREYRNKAWEAYKAQDYEKAAKYYIAYLRHNVTDEHEIYNLACCYGLLGKPDLAAEYIKRAYKTGYTDLNWLKNDPDFNKVKESEVFKNAVAELEEIMKQRKADSGQLAYVKSESFSRCYVKTPEAYNPDNTYNLIVGLHGYGSNPESFATVYKKFDNPDFIYAVPQAPYPFIESSGYSWSPFTGDEEIVKNSRALTADYIADVINDAKSKHKIGDVYLLGFSQGGNCAYKAGIMNHNALKGIIAFGAPFDKGWFDEHKSDIDAARKLCVFIAHGTDDAVVGMDNSENAAAMFAEHGFDNSMHTFKGVHEVPEDVLHKVQEWMKGK